MVYTAEEKVKVFADHLQSMFSDVLDNGDNETVKAVVSKCAEGLLNVHGDAIPRANLEENRSIIKSSLDMTSLLPRH